MGNTSSHYRPTAIDLFCGAGGLSLGFEQAGFDVISAVEADPVHAAVHRFNFPVVHISQHIPLAERNRLEYFARIGSLDDMAVRIPQAGKWFDELVEKVGDNDG
jgi:site-specific DNA-cytosine methylase